MQNLSQFTTLFSYLLVDHYYTIISLVSSDYLLTYLLPYLLTYLLTHLLTYLLT